MMGLAPKKACQKVIQFILSLDFFSKCRIALSMRQQTSKISQSYVLLIAISICFALAMALVATGCQTAPLENFEKVKQDMSKDAVLDILGSPNRTERIDGYDKW